MSFRKKMTILGLKVKKASPHLMFAAAILGIGYAFVASCVKARKMDEELVDEIEEVKAAEENLEAVQNDTNATEETVKEAVKAVKAARRKFIIKACRMFVIPVCVGVAAIGLLCGSHYILTNRLGLVTTTLAAVQDEYRQYRNGVKEKYGEEVDEEILYRNNTTTTEGVTVNEETGEEETSVVKVTDWRKGHSVYAVAFCKTMCGDMFQDNQYMDMLTLRNALKSISSDYEKDGVAWWRDFLKFIHYDIEPINVRPGWVEGNPDGDGYIDVKFIPTVFEFEDGVYENGYICEPNVDGDIESILPSARMKGLKIKK